MPYKIQKRAIRIIAASKYNAHTVPLFKKLNLLKACDICKLQELQFYHKLINRQLPKYFERFIYQTNLELHNYNTRRGHRLHIPRINHAFAQLNIRHSVIQTVNSMHRSHYSARLTPRQEATLTSSRKNAVIRGLEPISSVTASPTDGTICVMMSSLPRV